MGLVWWRLAWTWKGARELSTCAAPLHAPCFPAPTSSIANLSTQSALSDALSEGEAFTSSSHGLSDWSMRMSYLVQGKAGRQAHMIPSII